MTYIFFFTPCQLKAQTYDATLLHTFCSQGGDNCTDGAYPEAGLVQGKDSNFYGTTNGTYLLNGSGTFGTIFKITPSGTLTTLYGFCTQTCTGGGEPTDALAQGSDGNFYGTASGALDRITPSGALTTLYSFSCIDGSTVCPDGTFAYAGLVQGVDGNFYGTAYQGGANSNECGDDGCGTVFKITPSGKFTLLYSFCSQGGSNCTDGAEPYAGLVQGTHGNLYGSTWFGGAQPDYCDGFVGCGGGTIFKITPTGKMTTLYTFCTQGGPDGQGGYNCPDGAWPMASMIEGKDGNFYGTTDQGGH